MKKLPIFPLVLLVPLGLAGCQKHASSGEKGSQPSSPSSHQTAAQTSPAVASKTYDGPFGLAGGMSIAELKRVGLKPIESDESVLVGTVPKPVRGLSSYMVLASKATGACRIQARAHVPIANGSGDQIKAKVDELAEMLTAKYGVHSTKVNYVGPDVYKRNPEFWMLGVKEESVFYAYEWKSGKVTQSLPSDLDAIEVSAGADRTDSGYATLQYTFKNFDACIAANQKQSASNL